MGDKKIVDLRSPQSSRMTRRRGQFFILAAVIIVVVLVGFLTVRNYVQSVETPDRFFELSENIDREANRVIDNVVYNLSLNPSSGIEMFRQLDDFIDRSVASVLMEDPSIEVAAIYGNSTSLEVVNYAFSNLTVEGLVEGNGIVLLGVSYNNSLDSLRVGDGNFGESSYIFRSGDWQNISVSFEDDKEYAIVLKEHMAFYIVSRKKIGDNIYVYTSN
jgi:hypothetical protein